MCWFAGWPCRMFCSNLCLSERNASGRFFFLSQITILFSHLFTFTRINRSTTTRTWPRRSWWRSTRTTRRASSIRTSQSSRLERVPKLTEEHNCCQYCERIHLIQKLDNLLSMSLWSKQIDKTQI